MTYALAAGWQEALMHRILGLSILGLVLLDLASCGDGGTGTDAPTPVASVTVSLAELTLPVGESQQLTAIMRDQAGNQLDGRSVTWATTEPTVATVSATGLVTGVGPGAATVTATSEGKSGSVAVSVEPNVSLVITLPTNPIESGTSVQATASISSGSGSGSPASNVTWSSSNPAVASVSSDGLVTGARKGTATISATSEGLTGHVDVTVVPGAPASIRIYAGNNQSGPPGSQLNDPLCTNVMDAAGNLIIGAVVSYVVATGGGHLASPTTPATDASGIAISGLWTLGSTAGPQTVTASSTGAGSVTFTAVAQ
jgi:Bacterial Ig-like domain (group 2)